MKSTLRFFGFIGSAVLGYFLPSLIWSTSWGDLFQILSVTNNGDGQKLDWLTQITKELGLNQSSIREWAIQKILISIGIAIGVFILILILTAFIKTEKQNTQK